MIAKVVHAWGKRFFKGWMHVGSVTEVGQVTSILWSSRRVEWSGVDEWG